MTFRFVYRNNHKLFNQDTRICKLCDRTLTFSENCLERESTTLCYNCVHDVIDSYKDIKSDKR